MITVTATYARAHLYDLIDKVSSTGKRMGITKKGQLKVVLISNKEYEAWRNIASKFVIEE